MTRHFRRKLLTYEEFRRRNDELFPMLYLTSIGLIQNIALALIVQQVLSSHFPSDWSLRLLVVGAALASFAAIILIATEYCWFILILRQTTTYLDVAIPYILGATQFAPLFFIMVPDQPSDKGYYFLANAFFAGWGVIAYLHSYVYIDREDFELGDKSVFELTRHHALTNLISCIGLLVFHGSVYWTYDVLPMAGHIVAAWLAALFLIVIILRSRHFLIEVEDHYAAREQREAPSSPNSEDNEEASRPTPA